MIEVKNISKNYGNKQVLKNIKLSFNMGNVYGIVGENGAGKTTLFRCIAGLEKYTGSITPDLKSIKNNLGFLTTVPYFFPFITGKEYIQLLLSAREIKVENIEEKNIFDLPLNQYASTYSTGMQKKLALNAILLQKNTYFILDEPFNGVDIHSNMMIVQIIKKLKKLGKMLIISSHIFSTLSEVCDEIFLLKNGEILEKVTKSEFSKLEKTIKNFKSSDKINRLEF